MGKTDVVISKEEAVFWMDERGRWCNAHGRIRHRKITAFFNASIRWDRDGFYLYQEYDDTREKVYFRYVGTALFAVRLEHMDEGRPVLVLNTGQRLPLLLDALFEADDCLCMRFAGTFVRFNGDVTAAFLGGLDETALADTQKILDKHRETLNIEHF